LVLNQFIRHFKERKTTHVNNRENHSPVCHR
jgi:hypothetical protein